MTDSQPSKADALPVTLVIDAGHVVFTLYGVATAEDKVYFAAVTVGVYEATKGKQQ